MKHELTKKFSKKHNRYKLVHFSLNDEPVFFKALISLCPYDDSNEFLQCEIFIQY